MAYYIPSFVTNSTGLMITYYSGFYQWLTPLWRLIESECLKLRDYCHVIWHKPLETIKADLTRYLKTSFVPDKKKVQDRLLAW
jgi:hypothetical protein